MSIEILSSSAVRLNLTGEFNAEELTALLYRLAEARSNVAVDPGTPDGGMPIPIIAYPGWHTQIAQEGGVDTMVAFRHPGFGWLGFTLPPAHRVQLAESLIAQQRFVMNTAPQAIVAPADQASSTDESGGTVIH